MFQEHYLLPSTVDGAIWPLSPDHLKPRHFHAQLEFLLMLRGRAQVRIGRSVHTVHAGQLVWHLPGVEHALCEASSDCDLRVVHVEPDLCAEIGREFSELGPGCAPGRPGGSSFVGWTRGLGELASGRPVVELKQRDRDCLFEQSEVTCAGDGLEPGEVSRRLRLLLSAAWAATRTDHDDRRALSLVELASCLLFDDPSLGRSEICRALDVSEGHLSRRFQLELGISFLQQRARLRVARFVTHVTRERRNCLEAALASGFGSYSQLHRVFVQVVRASPQRYFSPTLRNSRANRVTLE
jgi:AraC-like DNA-binding protein